MMTRTTRKLAELWAAVDKGQPVDDEELGHLLLASHQALRYLEARGERFARATDRVRRDHDMLMAFRQARVEDAVHGGSQNAQDVLSSYLLRHAKEG